MSKCCICDGPGQIEGRMDQREGEKMSVLHLKALFKCGAIEFNVAAFDGLYS